MDKEEFNNKIDELLRKSFESGNKMGIDFSKHALERLLYFKIEDKNLVKDILSEFNKATDDFIINYDNF